MAKTTEHLDTDDQRDFRLRAREYMAGKLPPRLPDQPEMDFDDKALVALDRKIQKDLFDGGLAGITVPTEYGGQGLDGRYEAIFIEEAAPYRLPWHMGNNINIVLPTMLVHGAEHIKRHYIPKMLNGEHIWCQMTSEPSGGSDLFGLLTKAEKKGDKWVLNGSKVWTTGGDESDMAICLARTDPTVPKHAGLTMFLVDMKSPGMSIHPLTLMNKTKDFCQEYLDNVEVPEDHILGEVNGGWGVARTQLASEHAAVAKGWHMGVGASMPRETIELKQEYIDLARDLGVEKDADARQLVGEAFVIGVVADQLIQRIGRGIRSGALPPSIASLPACLNSGQHLTRVMSALTGPQGVAGPDAKWGMERVTSHRIGGGTIETQRNNISERYLGLPREPSADKNVPFNQLRQNTVPARA